jgi:hypothetical protein
MIIEMPNGEEVEFPDTMSDDEISAVLRKQYAAAPQSPTAPQRQWSDVPGEAARNFAPSAGRFASGLYEAVTSPVQTLKGAGDLAAGATRAGLRAIAPGLEAPGNEDTKRQDEIASAAWKALKARYGGEEEIKRTLATDPVGALADLSTILTPVAAAVPAGMTRTSRVANLAANITDPVYLAARGVQGLGKGASFAIREGLGGTTGAGGTAIGEAYRAGKAGGETAQTFRENMRGKADMTDVLESAKEGVANIRAERSANYSEGMGNAMSDQSRISFDSIKQAADSAVSSLFYKNKQLVSDAELRPALEAKAIVDDFAKDPTLHNAQGLDALKRRLDSVYPDSPMHNQAQRVISQMRNEVKGKLVAHSSDYGKVMDDFSESKRMQTEIEKTLSLGPNAAADTTLRKLGSSMRNNVNANFGRRLDVLDELAQRGGVQLRPALAGQALNSFIPRGLQASVATGAGFINPASIPYLGVTSPRLMGEAAHAAGRAAGIPGMAMDFAAQSTGLARAGRAVAERMPSRSALSRGAVVTGSVEDLLAETLAELKRRRR